MDIFAELIKQEFEAIAQEDEQSLENFDDGLSEEELEMIKNRCLEAAKKRIRLIQQRKKDCYC